MVSMWRDWLQSNPSLTKISLIKPVALDHDHHHIGDHDQHGGGI